MKPSRSFRALLLSPLLSSPAAAQAVIFTNDGAHSADQLGSAVAILPDVNGDFVEDYAVGAPFEDPDQNGSRPGTVRIYSGKYGTVLRTIVGPDNGSEFGSSIAVIPDISGDNRADLLIGAPSASHTIVQQGAAYLYESTTGLLQGSYYGSSMNEYLGTAVANVGDVDDDGEDDWAVGAPFADVNGVANCGRVRVYDGNTGAMIQEETVAYGGAQFGWRIAPAGDVNLDGKDDFLVGMPGASNGQASFVGAAELVLGGGSFMPWITRVGTEGFEQLGWSVASIGDVTGDARPDFAVGSPYFDGPGATRGHVVAYDGHTGALLWEVEGSADGWKLGWSMAAVGDYDGDGVKDLAVGAPGFLMVSVGEYGAVRIHSGDDGALITTLIGYEDQGDYGRAVASGRDLNNDNRQEILVGAPAENANGNNSGRARMLLGDVMRPTRYGTAKTNSAGCVPRIDFAGAPSRTIGNNFHVTATNILPNKSGMLFWGFTQVATPFHGGTLLVGQPLVRTGVQVSGGGASSCDGDFDFHFTSSLIQSYNLPAGQMVFAQYWYRDPGFALPDNIGLTNGLKFEIAN